MVWANGLQELSCCCCCLCLFGVCVGVWRARRESLLQWLLQLLVAVSLTRVAMAAVAPIGRSAGNDGGTSELHQNCKWTYITEDGNYKAAPRVSDQESTRGSKMRVRERTKPPSFRQSEFVSVVCCSFGGLVDGVLAADWMGSLLLLLLQP